MLSSLEFNVSCNGDWYDIMIHHVLDVFLRVLLPKAELFFIFELDIGGCFKFKQHVPQWNIVAFFSNPHRSIDCDRS